MKSFFDITRRMVEVIAVFLFSAVLILQTLNIFFRYTRVAAPWMWVEEFSAFAFIWILFLLWHISDRRGAHFMVDFAVDKLSPRGKKATAILGHVVALFFAAVVVWSSLRFIPTTMLYTTNSFDWLPMGVIYLVIPLGFILVAVERVRLLLRTLRL